MQEWVYCREHMHDIADTYVNLLIRRETGAYNYQ